jgi:hypothetical protein
MTEDWKRKNWGTTDVEGDNRYLGAKASPAAVATDGADPNRSPISVDRGYETPWKTYRAFTTKRGWGPDSLRQLMLIFHRPVADVVRPYITRFSGCHAANPAEDCRLFRD